MTEVSKLVADIVMANVDQAARTSDSLISYHKNQTKEVAKALIALCDAVDDCQVVHRHVLRVMDSDVVTRGLLAAERALEETDD